MNGAAGSLSADPGGGPLWRSGDPPVGLYVHVPFCRVLCRYCTFAKGLYETDAAEAWLRGLDAEIAAREAATWERRPALDTLFLGGGTPSALVPDQWLRLGDLLSSRFEFLPGMEFTAEANPESFLPEVATAMRGAGVDRVSLGSQSFDPRELAMLGRAHDAGAPARAVEVARAAGIDNVNLDLMYGLPGQGVEDFERSLLAALRLEPDHLSAYCLSLEPGTAMRDDVTAGRLARPDEDLAAAMYERLVARAGEAGFIQYEISNFARPGRECRHNLRYWTRSDVAALGPSAHALLGGRRWANPAPLEQWIRAYGSPETAPRPAKVRPEEARFEWVFLHLRLATGIPLEEYERRWGEPFMETYGSVATRLRGRGLLEAREGHLRLAPRARFVSDGILSEFAP